MYLSHVLFSRPAGSINLKRNEAHPRRAAETGAEHVLPTTPEELQVNQLCNSFCGASLVGVVVFKYIGIFLISRSWHCILLDTP